MGAEIPTDVVPPEIENGMRQFRELLERLNEANSVVAEHDEIVKEKRGLYDHYRQEYEVAVLRHNEAAKPLVELRSELQDLQMRNLDALMRWLTGADD